MKLLLVTLFKIGLVVFGGIVSCVTLIGIFNIMGLI